MATMGSWRELLFLYLILVNIESTLELGLWYDLTYFDTGSGNYSTNSTYQTNLNTLLSSLSNRTDGYGFYSSSFGDNPDKVYAIVLCRGDVELQTCRSCINDSTIKLPQLLPNSKGAIGWYEKCMLRYSDKSINGILATDPHQVLFSGTNATSVEEFKQARGSLLGDLRDKAASGGNLSKFATGQKMTGPDYVQTIYGLMQCTPDLSKIDCNNCLQRAARNITQLGAPTGWRILTPSCTLRYEGFLFYNDTPPATSANVTTKQGLSGGAIAVISSIGVAMGALLVVAVCIKWMFYRKNKVPGESSSQRDVELPRQIGRARGSTLENSDSLDITSRCYVKLAKATDYEADRVTRQDGESQLPNQPQGASDGDKNANTGVIGAHVSTGDTTMGGGIHLRRSNIDAPLSIGNTTINHYYNQDGAKISYIDAGAGL